MSVIATPPLLPRIELSTVFPPKFQAFPLSTTPDSEKQPKIATIPVRMTAFTGEWNRSLMFASGVGRTRSKDIANSILDAVKMNGGMSFAIQKTPNTTRRTFTEPSPIALPGDPRHCRSPQLHGRETSSCQVSSTIGEVTPRREKRICVSICQRRRRNSSDRTACNQGDAYVECYY